MIEKMFFSFCATWFFAHSINAPKKSLFITGLIGTSGWSIYLLLSKIYNATIFTSFIGALVVALLSELAARQFKMPVTIFLIPGIIPLVPGRSLYYTMFELVEKNYTDAIHIGSEALFISGAIAIAIALISTIFKMKKRVE